MSDTIDLNITRSVFGEAIYLNNFRVVGKRPAVDQKCTNYKITKENLMKALTCKLNPIIDISKPVLDNILKELFNAQQEIISSPIRFNGVHIEDIKRIFEKYGINTEMTF